MENKDELLKIWEGVDYVLSTQQGTRAECYEKIKATLTEAGKTVIDEN